ncbi:MAG: hypothetical protein L0H29_06040 [Sinobacteraceae bacterium]|nr:hypothetical protein [Nevskiaceae bacterium]
MSELVGGRASAQKPVKLPIIQSGDPISPEHWCYRLFIPPELAWFVGHFPDQPVLPGVAQIGWAIRFARQAFQFDADPLRIDRVKFQQPIVPGDSVQLTLRHKLLDGLSQVDWCYEKDARVSSRGRLAFQPTS